MKFRIRALLIATALIAVIVAAMGYAVVRLPGYKLRLASFHKQLAEKTTSQDLQQWAISSIADQNKAFENEIPEILTVPKFGSPSYLKIIGNGPSAYVYAHWGGGFGHWGIMVGNKQLPFPRGNDYDYIEWAPGVYVWHELQ